MKNKFLSMGIASSIFLASCNKEEVISKKDNELKSFMKTEQAISSDKKEQLLSKFASILSKAIFESQDLRAFIKMESLKQFDNNYDVLYYLVKDETIGSKTFRDILISYSSTTEIEEIESSLPLLNILIPEIAIFEINPKDLDVSDQEIPIAVSKEKVTSLFLDGREEAVLEKGQVPDFHVFVVNENSRVIAPQNSLYTKRSVTKSVQFKSPNYDRNATNNSQTKARSLVSASNVGQKAISAYAYFNRDDGSVYQKAFQRDFIYYGITPKSPVGSLNRSVSEYVGFIEINPRTYFKIADQTNTGSINDDSRIKETTASQEKRELTEQELIDRMWTKGAYDFRFEIIRSTADRPQIVYIPLKPNEIWNFNLKYERLHKTWFRRSKHTYTIDPNSFTSKRVDLRDNMVSFGKWDLSTESLYRGVQIYEEDEGIEKDETFTYESIRVKNTKFNGDIKLSIGLGEGTNASIGVSGEVSTSNTTKENKTITIKRKESSDDLGRVNIYFYDPIIKGKDAEMYDIHTYSTGHVTFGIFVK